MAEPIDKRAIREALHYVRANLAHQQEHPQLFAEFLDLLSLATEDALSLARISDHEIGFEELSVLLKTQASINQMFSRLLINSQYERMSELVFASREDIRLCSSVIETLGNILSSRNEELGAMIRRLHAA